MTGHRILIGVSGGIAAYKTCDLVRGVVREGHEARVVMTRSAAEFVRPLTFEVLSRNPVPRGLFDPRTDPSVEHVEAADWADAVVIAPATANVIGKLAGGIADDLLTTLLLAVPAGTPVVLAPAMNTKMWDNPVMRRNLKFLLEETDGRYSAVGPVVKELACGDLGMGGMAAVEDIYIRILDVLKTR
jgi:phosphopantothenoylcysteine decarboxylase/phosphopantothenate--cysteine ligase